MQRKIETIYQDMALCENLDDTLNLFLRGEPIRTPFGIFKQVDRLLISHKWQDVFAVTTRSVVMRCGGKVSDLAIAEITGTELVSLMVGAESVLTLLFCLIGALPFSLWVGRVALKTDIRHFGDANPGATNVFRAGGRAAAALALLLDFSKGAIPVGIAHLQIGLTGWDLIAVALAPILGHAFSPFLGFRGGKAVAVTGGIWCGLTGWEGPTIAGILLGLGTWLFGANGKAVLLSQIGLGLWLLLTPPSWNLLHARPTLFEIVGVTSGALLLLLWKHRGDFASS